MNVGLVNGNGQLNQSAKCSGSWIRSQVSAPWVDDDQVPYSSKGHSPSVIFFTVKAVNGSNVHWSSSVAEIQMTVQIMICGPIWYKRNFTMIEKNRNRPSDKIEVRKYPMVLPKCGTKYQKVEPNTNLLNFYK